MIDIVCFGEVLWDVFQEHEKIGGAPLNVANRLKSFTNNVSIISRIGSDERGNKIVELFKENGVDVSAIQVDKYYKTGKVKVILNDKGSASYDIMFPRAWDKIELTKLNQALVKKSDVFVYGSLVARDDISRQTLYNLLSFAKYKIFDINLRPPYYTIDVLNHLMNQADFIKFNDDEIFEISKKLDSGTQSLEQNIVFIAKHTSTNAICVTKGRHGAILYYKDKFYYNSGYKIQVVDTVGAGDSFLASIINQLLKNVHPQEALNFACAVGAIVASSKGANPDIKAEDLGRLLH